MTSGSEKIDTQGKPLPQRALGHPEATRAGTGTSRRECEGQGTGLRTSSGHWVELYPGHLRCDGASRSVTSQGPWGPPGYCNALRELAS